MHKILIYLALLCAIAYAQTEYTIDKDAFYYADPVDNPEGFYGDKEGKPITGVINSYYKNGKLASTLPYKNGKKEGTLKIYWESGKLKEETVFINGLKEGGAKGYNEDGSLDYESVYKNGALDGVTTHYHKNRKIERIEALWKNGKYEGATKYYCKGGATIEAVYKENLAIDAYRVDSKGVKTALEKGGMACLTYERRCFLEDMEEFCK
ncbi:MAG: toxin-antitoxin system YwqK family antitoxin [Helicobacteraceae bacterium]|nr:toxin-antitoxin system YwqK family antitoxin [Helicobacteraceae bacterium]